MSRIRKVNALLATEISSLLKKEIEIPHGTLATVKEVQVSADLGVADIYISVFPDNKNEEVIELLEQNKREIQKALNKKLVMSHVPKIRFKHDIREETAGRIYKLLDESDE